MGITCKSMSELQAGLDRVRLSPKSAGTVECIVCRPAIGERKVLERGELSLSEGLVGDNWRARGNRHTADGLAHPDTQINLMNARAISLIAGGREHWAAAGDQFFVDLDLGSANLPPGTRLRLGTALIEVTAQPHLGCRKFAERFGKDAVQFVNSDEGKELNLRGICARVVVPGTVDSGGSISKEMASAEARV